ncbi:MAG: IPT/TIG domain-containing protein [Planctomycetes bacterium]|nr:IPT/TIG domain-containing protein [Planctomycetota bacterium]
MTGGSLRNLLSAIFACSGLLSAAGMDPLAITFDAREADLVIEAEEPLQGVGFEVFSLGDVNGDAFEDLAFFGGRDPAYHAFILYGTRSIATELDRDRYAHWGTRIESTSGQVWCVPAPVGDVNGDGFDDMIFRRCEVGTFPVESGIVLGSLHGFSVLYGRADMPPDLDPDSIGEALPGFSVRPQNEDMRKALNDDPPAFQDLTGDGFSDIIIGAAQADVGDSKDAGTVYVVFGRPEMPPTIMLSDVGGSIPGLLLRASHPGPVDVRYPRCFGFQAGDGGDLDGDGIEDLLISAPGWEIDGADGHLDAGAVFLLYGAGSLGGQLDLGPSTPARTLFFSTVGARTWAGILYGANSMGSALVAGLGDIDGDGRPDIGLSSVAPHFSPGATAPGGFMVVLGRNARFPQEIEIDSAALAGTVIPSTRSGGGGEIRQLARLGDWDGDNIDEIAVALPAQEITRPDFYGRGAVYVVFGRTPLDGELNLYALSERTVQIPSQGEFGFLGSSIAACDLDGDGRKELAIGEPGQTFDRFTAGSIGSLYVIRGGRDLRGDLALSDFSPKFGAVAGHARVTILGRGFTSRTQVYFGDEEGHEYERLDSRRLWVKAPPALTPGLVTIRVVNEGAEASYATPFEYRDLAIPVVTDIVDPGAPIVRVTNDGAISEQEPFAYLDQYVKRAGDMTGDGMDDLLFVYQSNRKAERPKCVFLLHGGECVPGGIRLSRFERYGTEFYLRRSDVPIGFPEAIGDLNGDRVQDIAMFAEDLGMVYVVFAGPLPKGLQDVDEWIACGNGLWIEEAFLHAPPIRWGGDVTGDGIDDIGFVSGLELEDTESEGDQRFYDLYVVFGRRLFQGRSTIEDEAGSGRAIRVAYSDEYFADRMWKWYVEDLSRAGDVDGDGIADFALVCSSQGEPSPGAGLYLVRGLERSRFRTDLKLGVPREFDASFLWVSGYNRRYGLGRCDGGYDISGDGRPDVLLTDENTRQDPPGRAFVVFGGGARSRSPGSHGHRGGCAPRMHPGEPGRVSQLALGCVFRWGPQPRWVRGHRGDRRPGCHDLAQSSRHGPTEAQAFHPGGCQSGWEARCRGRGLRIELSLCLRRPSRLRRRTGCQRQRGA